jgi:hypothetical protein
MASKKSGWPDNGTGTPDADRNSRSALIDRFALTTALLSGAAIAPGGPQFFVNRPGRVRRRGSRKRGCTPGRRALSISLTVCDTDAPWACAISFRPLQNASSSVMLVLYPSMRMWRLMTADFMAELWSNDLHLRSADHY